MAQRVTGTITDKVEAKGWIFTRRYLILDGNQKWEGFRWIVPVHVSEYHLFRKGDCVTFNRPPQEHRK